MLQYCNLDCQLTTSTSLDAAHLHQRLHCVLQAMSLEELTEFLGQSAPAVQQLVQMKHDHAAIAAQAKVGRKKEQPCCATLMAWQLPQPVMNVSASNVGTTCCSCLICQSGAVAASSGVIGGCSFDQQSFICMSCMHRQTCLSCINTIPHHRLL